MNNAIISFNTAFSAVRFLQDGMGHRRLWITKYHVGMAGVEYYYALVDWDHRVLADWNEETHRWDLRSEAWTVVLDSRDDLPENLLTEVISEEQLFQLSTIEGFL